MRRRHAPPPIKAPGYSSYCARPPRERGTDEGFKEESTFAGTRVGEHGDAYFVQHGGRKWQLERHLKGCNARDQRRESHLHFFWDADDREVVVGWLPNHLPTRIS